MNRDTTSSSRSTSLVNTRQPASRGGVLRCVVGRAVVAAAVGACVGLNIVTVPAPEALSQPVAAAGSSETPVVLPGSNQPVVPLPSYRWGDGLRGQTRKQYLDYMAAQVRFDNPADDQSFYQYQGDTPLEVLAPGTVLASRDLTAHVQVKTLALPTDIALTQLLYRTTDALGRPTATVVSVLHPPHPTRGIVAYGTYYDSLNPADNPSRIFAGNRTLGGGMQYTELMGIAPHLAAGHTVVIPDIEGPHAHFLAGPEYGRVTLDALRAVGGDEPVALLGYSGGAVASLWAASLAPSYAPEINARLVGVVGGVPLVNPLASIDYLTHSPRWSAVVPMALVGIARAYGINLDPYLTELGKTLTDEFQDASLVQAQDRFDQLAWKDIVHPDYPDVYAIKEFADIVDDNNLLLQPVPTVPVLLVAAGDYGDGVVVNADVRALHQSYCDAGLKSTLLENPLLDHMTAIAPYHVAQLQWIQQRFDGLPAPTTCR